MEYYVRCLIKPTNVYKQIDIRTKRKKAYKQNT